MCTWLMIRKTLIYFLLKILNDHRLDYLRYLNSSPAKSFEELSRIQLEAIKELINHSYRNVPFYKYWFDLHDVDISGINSLDDFSDTIPVLTKKDIIKHYDKFSAPGNIKFVEQSTGGSTGQTLKFRMSRKDHDMGKALLLRGMGKGGYTLGDRILVLAGGSLVKRKKRKLNLIPKLLNQYKISSYGLSKNDFAEIVSLLEKKKIRFLRGYASSIYFLADYCKSKAVSISFKAVFSTGESLLDKQRHLIEETFKCKVYNQYGLNDGGVSAFEYDDEDGLVVDMERAFLELAVSTKDNAGTILATSLYNYSFPFIRYDTGDSGTLEVRELKSGERRPVITKLLGRVTEYLLINDRRIGGPVLTVLMGKTNAEQYSIIQKGENELEIQIKKGINYSKKDEDFIIKSFEDNCGTNLSIKFTYVDAFSNKNKHRFIINEVDSPKVNQNKLK